ncbi:S49 family peptidase [Parasediminibacterium paludis]|uniref:S49 family peptidase n=1 Tax=Parasediminibacterium paludis TaxID=908966 RepID=A0ABV8PV17_9BACT
MQFKQLLSILNRPWAIEPQSGEYWRGIAFDIIYKGITGVATFDNRKYLSEIYRTDAKGTIDNSGPIQVIHIAGPIAKYDMCGSAGTQSLQNAVRAANADNSIAAMLLVIDSPGGQVDGTENLANEIKASTKPVVAFVDGMMCSAAYWIGSSATEIFADKANNGYNATIGSIGTMVSWKDATKAQEAQGIKTHTVYADASVDKNQTFAKANQGDYTELKQQLNNINDTFLSAVQANRMGKLDLAKENVLTGKTYDAKQAIKYGLIDRMGTFQQAVSRAYFLSKNKTA